MLATGQQQLTEDLLNCAICFEPFSTPKTLPCLHTFCESCLNDNFTAYKSMKKRTAFELQCPTCREYCDLPPEGISGLKSDFKVSKMAELMKHVQRRQGEVAKCGICELKGMESKSTHFCGSCTLNFCHDCTRIHNENPLFRGHSATPTTDTDSTLSCKTHPLSTSQHYCEECKMAVCAMCILTEHRHHNVIECSVLQRQKFQKLQKPIQSNIDHLQKTLRDLQMLETDMTVCYDQSRQCISQTRNKLLKRIDEKCAIMFSSLAKVETEQRAEFLEQKETIETSLAELQSLREFSSGLLDDTEKSFYPGLHKVVKDMEAASKYKLPKITKTVKCAHQFKPDFDLNFGELVEIDLIDNKLDEDTVNSTIVKPKKASPDTVSLSHSKVDSQACSCSGTTPKSSSKSRFSLFKLGKFSSKSKDPKPRCCKICESKPCLCEKRSSKSQSGGIVSSTREKRTRTVSDCVTSRVDSHTQLRETDLPLEDLKKKVSTSLQTSSPVVPSAPPLPDDDADADDNPDRDDVFDDSGVCDSSDASDREAGVFFLEIDEELKSKSESELKKLDSNPELCTSDQCAPMCLSDEIDEIDEIPKIAETKQTGVKDIDSPMESSQESVPCSSSHSSAGSSRSSSLSSSPALSRHRSGSAPLSLGLPFGSRKHGYMASGARSQSLSGLLLGQVVDHLSRAQSRSFR